MWSGFAMNVTETAVPVRQLLDAVLVDDVVVRHRERVRVAEVDLLLARPASPFELSTGMPAPAMPLRTARRNGSS